METPGIADILLNAYPAMTREVAQRAEGIVHAYHGLERELIILADEITMRTANHVPVAADELEGSVAKFTIGTEAGMLAGIFLMIKQRC